MHIRDGILGPEVCAVAAAISIGAVAYSLRRLRADLEDRAVPVTGMMAALVFAGQMVNFPLPGLAVSGHLLGGVLAAVILGPWAGCIATAMVLTVQSILFSDGGLMSLGANVLNMAVVGAWGGYAVYASLRRLVGTSHTATVASAMASAWISVLASAALFCVEFSFSSSTRGFDPRGVLSLMVLYHAIIGIGEAMITGSVLGFVVSRRTDLIPTPVPAGATRTAGRFVAAGLVVALAIAAVLAPFKSELPDGLDAVATTLGFSSLEKEPLPLVFANYEIPLPSVAWWPQLPVSAAGIVGTVVVFIAVAALLVVARRQFNSLKVADRTHGQ